MSELKDIVPPLELCKQIPAGEFEESVLVWTEHGVRSSEELSRLEFCKNLTIRKLTFPAPTLAEILAELPEGVQMRMRTARNRERHFQIYHYSYEAWTNLPAAAALRMWLRIRREAGR